MPKQSKKKRERIMLLNGCYTTAINVMPDNWDKPGADATKDWLVWYRFYDPSQADHPKYPGVRLISIKVSKTCRTLTDKRKAVEGIIAGERQALSQGWNHITETFMKEDLPADTEEPELTPDTPFELALTKAYEEKVCSPSTKANLKSVKKFVLEAAGKLNYCHIQVKDIKRRHIKTIFKQLAMIKKEKWTTSTQEYFRAHLNIMYLELMEWGAVEYSPVGKKPKDIIPVKKSKRPILSNDERILIDRVLKEHHYEFWRYIMIFFMAGCRRTEILQVQGKDVDLVAQKFTATRKKGRKYVIVEYTITNQALYLWRELMEDCGPEDYVFSRALVPGADSIRPEQVTRRWKRHVKDKYGIKADLYSLKHLMATLNVQKSGTTVAAQLNNESEKMINDHYDVDAENRKHQVLKKINHDFAPVDKAG